ncbi:MAG TPA: BrnT family toxin [Candidatus Angelobacter sp.]|jgi:hypothetical protein|nr:BrnT family toxin [Candidatus Angelobacter sp.]
MRFEWDDRKNAANIKKHGMDFSQASQMFSGLYPLLAEPDLREDYAEERWCGIGRIGTKVAVVIFTHDPSFTTIRIISLREAEAHEQNNYYSKTF